MNCTTVSRQVPIAGRYDVVVVGAGPAGFIAAIAAGREGASCALIERFGFLGGAATACMVAPISVFSYNGKRVIGGIPWQFVERLEQIGGARVEQPLNNVSFDPELYKLVAQRMVLEAGVDLFTNSYMTACQSEAGHIDRVVIANKGGLQALEASVFVDCTGDADLACMAGVPMQPRDGEYQPASLIFALDGVDTSNLPSIYHNRQGVNCLDAAARECLLNHGEDAAEFGGPWFCTLLRPGRILVNMTRTAVDALDCRDTARAECRLREDAFRYAGILRELPAFKDCFISHIAPAIGIRESRRIKGLHTITSDEYIAAMPYPDWITRSCHPIDIHQAGSAAQECSFLKKPAYIPYRSLVAESFDNLIVAGRCISAEKRAFASLRVQAPVMGTGHAAGLAAAIAARDHLNISQLDGAHIHNLLASRGACLE